MALRKRGYRATVVTNEFFGDQIRASGLEFIAMGTMREGGKSSPIRAFGIPLNLSNALPSA
jgi:hypothetical protein